MAYHGPMKTGRPEKTPRSDFGARLCRLREAAGFSQAEMAKQLGLTQAGYALWERRRVALRADQIVMLAEVLGVSVEALFHEAPAKRRTVGPSGRAKRLFERVSKLSRPKQKKILDVVEDWLIPQTKA